MYNDIFSFSDGPTARCAREAFITNSPATEIDKLSNNRTQ